LLAALRAEGLGCIAYSPLAQGLLTNRYLRNIPADSRAAKPHGALAADVVTDQMRRRIARLDDIARARGQSLAQLALVWVLRDQVVTSAIVGTSRVAQLEDNVAALHNLVLSPVELDAIDSALADT
jgi:L-glyceraldehyde 3-phosphate reductase